MNRESQLIAQGYAQRTGQLPQHGDRLPTIRLRQVRARVLDASFFWRNRKAPTVGEVITGDWDLIRGLAKRGLVEELAQ